MQSGQLILALSNPIPEIDPDLASSSGAACATDGQIVNNVLEFPGILRGAVDSNARLISNEMYLAAAAVAKQAVKQGLAHAEFVTYVNEYIIGGTPIETTLLSLVWPFLGGNIPA